MIAQLRGKPLSANQDEQARYTAIIRSERYWIGLDELEVGVGVECQLCKEDTHPTWDCQIQKAADWKGPTDDGAERHEKRIKKTVERESASTRRGKPVTRARKPGRGRGRGASSSSRGRG